VYRKPERQIPKEHTPQASRKATAIKIFSCLDYIIPTVENCAFLLVKYPCGYKKAQFSTDLGIVEVCSRLSYLDNGL
jgi:hypothetical protein